MTCFFQIFRMLQQMISQVILSISRDTPLYISSQQAGKSLNTRRTGLRKPSLLSSRRIGTRLRSKLKSKKNLQDQKMSSKYGMSLFLTAFCIIAHQF
uniref:Uncharacterized protein n=1 Tax=Cannabis sativa TaxID=3483 RepID=A0A803QTX5_CANSA